MVQRSVRDGAFGFIRWGAVALLIVGACSAVAATPADAAPRAVASVSSGSAGSASASSLSAAASVHAQVRISIGWGIYVTYNRAEVARIAKLPIDKVRFSSILCAAIPNPLMATACGVYVYDSATSIASTFRTAAKQGRCVQTKYASPSTIIGWKVIAC